MNALKDYYHTLGVEKSASLEEIKRAYRQLALRYHPDRNPGDADAEEQFKLISEAYAVLVDPAKRAQYDQARTHRPQPDAARESGFSYSQEDIFRDFFASAYARQAFRDFGKEFEQAGVRFDEKFFQRVFFGGRGFFFGGVFFTGPGFGRIQRDGGPAFRTTLSRAARAGRPVAASESTPPRIDGGVMGRWGRRIKTLAQSLLKLPPAVETPAASDINFHLTISREQATNGAQVKMVYHRNDQPQKLSVKVPPGTRNGAKLRLKNMGRSTPDGGNGDLFLHIRVAS